MLEDLRQITNGISTVQVDAYLWNLIQAHQAGITPHSEIFQFNAKLPESQVEAGLYFRCAALRKSENVSEFTWCLADSNQEAK